MGWSFRRALGLGAKQLAGLGAESREFVVVRRVLRCPFDGLRIETPRGSGVSEPVMRHGQEVEVGAVLAPLE